MKLVGELPAIRLTAVIVQGVTDNKVRVLGPKGGGNRASSALRPKKSKALALRRRGGAAAPAGSARLPRAKAA